MTLNEAIEKEKLVAVSYCDMATACHTNDNINSKEEESYRAKAEYYAQIAEWLSELKQLRKQLKKQESIPDKISAEIRNKMDKCFICNKEIQRDSIPRIEPKLNKIMLNEGEEEHPVCDACGNLLSIAFRMYEGNLKIKKKENYNARIK